MRKVEYIVGGYISKYKKGERIEMEEKYIIKIFDVGQAQAIAFYNKETSECCFVDLGSKYNPPVKKFLEKNDFEKISLCITHWHDDHYDNITDLFYKYEDKIKDILNPTEKFTNKEYLEFCYALFCSKYSCKDTDKCRIPCFGKNYEDFLNTILSGPDKKDLQKSIKYFAKNRGLDEKELFKAYYEAHDYIEKYSVSDFIVNQFLNSDGRSEKVALLKKIEELNYDKNPERIDEVLTDFLNRHSLTISYNLDENNFTNREFRFDEPFKEEEYKVFDWLTIHAIMVNPTEYVKRHKEKTDSVMNNKNNFGLQYIAEVGVENKHYVFIPGDVSKKIAHLTRELMLEGNLPISNAIREHGFDCMISPHHGSNDATDAKTIEFFCSLATFISAYKEVYNLPSDEVIEAYKKAERFFLITSKNEGITSTIINSKMFVKTGVMEKQIERILAKEEGLVLGCVGEILNNTHTPELTKYLIEYLQKSKEKTVLDCEVVKEKVNSFGYHEWDNFLEERIFSIEILNFVKECGVAITKEEVKENSKNYFTSDGETKNNLTLNDFVPEKEEINHTR